MPAYRGQRVESFQFTLINGLTNEPLRELTPERGSAPSLSHDTTSSVKRRLTLQLGVNDTASVNVLTDRITPYMTVNGVTYPLGRYMFTSPTITVSTGGNRGQYTLLDEGFIIDQQLERGYNASTGVRDAILGILEDLPLQGIDVASSPYLASGSFSAGQTRGQAIEAYATQGDYFSYWMGNDSLFHMIRTIDPALEIPDFDFDAGFRVVRDSISETSDIIDAPNKFIVVSNSNEATEVPIVGVYEVPSTAPFSIFQRGFTIPKTQDIQAATQIQATAAARNLGIRSTVFERVTMNTMLDPRHDSYNVIRWAGENWLELSWTMTLTPGGPMQHTMRKAYMP